MNRFEQWTHGNGGIRDVEVIRRLICDEDVCPECERTILVAVATTNSGGQVFRLECLFCQWTTDALPDPEMERGAFKRHPVRTMVARRLAGKEKPP